MTERSKAETGALPRREQQRATETKELILQHALQEFAERGYDGASARRIATRAQIVHPLITYHYRNKETLWKAVAEHYLSSLLHQWERRVPSSLPLAGVDRVRCEFQILCEVLLANPAIHHFMLQENRAGSPRMEWLAENALKPLLHRILPHIEAAQQDGKLPPGQPILLYYMMVGMASVLSSLGGEISLITGWNLQDPEIRRDYLAIMENVLFGAASRA